MPEIKILRGGSIKVKPALSMKGWELKKWILGNQNTLKEILKVLVPMMVAYISNIAPWAQVLVVLVGKLALDSFEFWLKEVKLDSS